MIIVYLSGKMTGLAESEYKENFRNAEMFYRACGYEVVNPCNLSEIVLKRKPDASYEDFDEVLAVGLKAPYELTRLCKEELTKNKGRIINIASSRYNQSEPNSECYASAKGGIVALTHASAMSLAPDVLVNCIAPGWIQVEDYEISEIDRASVPAGKIIGIGGYAGNTFLIHSNV